MAPKLKMLLAFWVLALSGCSTGINAGGKTIASNGGSAFIVMAIMLVLLAATLWFFIGKED